MRAARSVPKGEAIFDEIWRSVVDALGVGVLPLDLTAAEIALKTVDLRLRADRRATGRL